jgi:5-methylcytosine-specific restriction endonuclease McrA
MTEELRKISGFRFFYNKDLEFFKEKYKSQIHPHHLESYAKQKLRMYANLFCRDMRKILLKEDSECSFCNSKINLQIDHVIPVMKNGKNTEANIQILCKKCNLLKKDAL